MACLYGNGLHYNRKVLTWVISCMYSFCSKGMDLVDRKTGVDCYVGRSHSVLADSELCTPYRELRLRKTPKVFELAPISIVILS